MPCERVLSRSVVGVVCLFRLRLLWTLVNYVGSDVLLEFGGVESSRSKEISL